MQFRAAKSLWRNCRLLRYSIPRAMSTMNFTSVCRGTNCEGKAREGSDSASPGVATSGRRAPFVWDSSGGERRAGESPETARLRPEETACEEEPR